MTLRNRVVLPPMCQYSIEQQDGVPTDWQLVHLGSRAAGGFGLVIAEATAVVPEGRISNLDVGLWNEQQVQAWKPVTQFIHAQGAAAGVQLAHAGAKGSTYGWLRELEAQGKVGSLSQTDGGWDTVSSSPSDLFDLNPAQQMSVEEIGQSVRDWAAAAVRADEAGFDMIQIHGAHGYLIHQFLSPLSNARSDQYGGSWENRTRYVREIVAAILEVWPEDKVLGIRLSGEDWVQEGWGIDDTVRLAAELYRLGVRTFDISSAGIGPYHGPTGPGYQVPLAAAVKAALPQDAFVTAVGVITEPVQAEHVLVTHQADGVSVGRVALGDPQWANRAAQQLGAKPAIPSQYWRGRW